jgi:hypothetical protein
VAKSAYQTGLPAQYRIAETKTGDTRKTSLARKGDTISSSA